MTVLTAAGGRLRIGLYMPVVVQTPGGHADWEETATVEDIRRVAVEADGLGFHHLTCSEHVVIPADGGGTRGSTYYDPVATLGWVAGMTGRIGLATNVVVLGYHHPAELLKRYGTLDRLSGGRVILGVGVGSLREEFDLLGASFGDRGARADDALRALRQGWGADPVEYHGSHYSYGPFRVQPTAPRRDVRIWVGGQGARSLRRAVELGDGWTPFGLRREQLRELLDTHEVPAGFDVVVAPGRPLDPVGDPERTLGILEALADAGVTVLHGTFAHASAAELVAQMHALARLLT